MASAVLPVFSTRLHTATGATLRVVALSAFQDNYLWVVDDGQQACAVDPGDAVPVHAWLQQEALTLSAVLITHHHADHIGGVRALTTAFPQAQVWGPSIPSIEGVQHLLQGGETLRLLAGQFAVQVLATPGHTQGHISYYWAGEGDCPPYLWCGDTLFSAGCGRIFDGTAAQLHASLQQLAQLPPPTQICCAHEYTLSNLRFAVAVEADNPAVQLRQRQAERLRAVELPTIPTVLAAELTFNPFLRCAEPSVQQAVKQYCATTGVPLPSDVAETFAALRAWKNVF